MELTPKKKSVRFYRGREPLKNLAFSDMRDVQESGRIVPETNLLL